MAAAAPPPAAALEQLSKTKMFGGHNLRFRHPSAALGCPMTFSLFLPASPASKLPVLYWLSGLTCTDKNFIIKSGAQRAAAAHGVALVAPDTSPRGLNVEGEADSWDFGVVGTLSFLRLHRNKLAGDIPTSLGHLTKLVKLDLQENMLTGTVPLEVLSLILVGDLTELNVAKNNLAGTARSSKPRVATVIQDTLKTTS